ncbi:hypothetical protein NUACC26_038940 [Scytonema sp. NUACC26]
MIERLFVNKKFGTYADAFLMLGLTQLVEYALKETKQKSAIQLLDEGTRYCIQFQKAVNLEPIAKLVYFDPFPIVKGQKTDIKNIPKETILFDTVEQSEARKIYREYLLQQRGKPQWTEDAPAPPDPRTQNGVLLTSMRHDRNHNGLWQISWQFKDSYGALIASLFQGFSQENTDTIKVSSLFEQATGCKLPKTDSAVKVYLPTAVQGVNRVKADCNKVDSQTADWLDLWLIATGLFHFAVAERVKIAENVYDWRVVALQPKDIQFSKYREVLKTLRQYNPPGGGNGIARFDAELILRFCQELLNHQQVTEETEPDDFNFCQPVNHFVSNFVGTHFSSKGQVYGVKEVFNLGLPSWISPRARNELRDYQTVLQEHLSVVRSLSIDEGNSELLNLYRDFISGTDLYQFFPFQVSYADYVIKRLADSDAKIALFSKYGLDLMTKNFKHRQNKDELDLTEITKNPGFLNIAKAINSATVYAGIIRDKEGHTKDTGWDRIYGLAQRLSSQAGSKQDFITELSSFLASYENENLRKDEELRKQGKPRRIWTTKDDLDNIIDLIDRFSPSLIANLLIAYGYAKGWGKAKETDKTEAEQTDARVNSEEGVVEND